MLEGKTLYEKLFGCVPSIDHLKVFGCLCYAQATARTKDKFAPQSKKCILSGVPMVKRVEKYLNWRVKKYLSLEM